MRVFLDANIFFAATRSPKGGSGFILELAKKRRFQIITIAYALLEAEKNIKNKLGIFYLLHHYQNLLEINPKIQSIESASLREIAIFEKLLPTKDIPILIGAIANNSQFLITLDKKHFLNNENLKRAKFSFEIINPGEFLTKYILK